MLRHLPASLAAMAVALAIPATASAFTECQGTVSRIFAGDGGAVYVFLKVGAGEGPAGVLVPSDPNREAILSMAMTAQISQRQVIMRFSADGASCTTNLARFDFVGMYLQ